AGRGLLVAGELYGQGSSREAAAVAPMYLGVRAVLAKSFAPIHRANLINWGVVPLTIGPDTYDAIEPGEALTLEAVRDSIAADGRVTVVSERTGARQTARCILTTRERDIRLTQGVLNHTQGTSWRQATGSTAGNSR